MESPTRRRLLWSTGVIPVVALAGCSALVDSGPSATETPGFERLTETSIYTSDDVGLRLPGRIPRVDEPDAADLIVLHGNPAVDAEQGVSWLTDDRVVALLGDRAQETWIGWTESEAYRDAFGAGGTGVGEPAPHLLVAAAVGTHATTYRYSWGDQPTNGEILDALDEAMADIETRTPR